MSDASSVAAGVLSHEGMATQSVRKRTFAAVAGGGAVLGAITGVAIAVPLALAAGPEVFIATAIDVAIGLALIGGLIGANISGTD